MTSLPHIECNNETNEPAQPQASGIDDLYPYNSSPIENGSTDNTTGGGDDFGRIGKVGYDFRNGNYVSKTLYHDIMSYCTRQWISDYNYKKLYDFQQQLDNYFYPGSSPLIVGNEFSISNPYVRKVARTLSSQNPVSNEVTYFNGIVRTDGSFQVLNTSFLTRKIIPLLTGEYEYVVQTVDGEIYRGFFLTTERDHSSNRGFSFLVPTQKALRSLQVFSTSDGQEVFNQDYGTASALLVPTQLERLSNTSWKIPATKQGKRIVARVSPTRALLLSDPDEESVIIEGNVGDQIEIQYQTPGKVVKFNIELR